jgi:cardiolipin synthase A/B
MAQPSRTQRMNQMGRKVLDAWTTSLRPRLLAGHQIELLCNGEQFFPALLQALNQASNSIYLETYIFENDRSGVAVAHALADAAQRGVAVHLLVDGYGTKQLAGEVATILASSLVRVRVFRPEPRWFSLSRQRLRRLHRKLCVVDGQTAFVGGINVLDDLYDPNHGALQHPRFDFAVRVQGPLVSKVGLAVRRLWWEVGLVQRLSREVLGWPEQLRTDGATPQGPHRAMFVVRDNLRFRRTIEQMYLRSIARARREVIIANAYFFPGARFRKALITAARRGVRVRLLLQGKVEYPLQHYASQAMYNELLEAGIEICEYQRSFLHAKVAVMDDWCTIGSSNIDPFSLLLAREANVVVWSATFSNQLRVQLEKAMADAPAITPSVHAARPWPLRLMNRLAFVLLRMGIALTGVAGRY